MPNRADQRLVTQFINKNLNKRKINSKDIINKNEVL